MKTKRIIALMLLPLLLDVLIVSCCDCAPPENFSYTNCTVETQNLNNAGPKAEVTNADNVPKEAFGLRLTINRRKNVCMNSAPPMFSSSAYAFDCDCDRINFNSLDSIKLLEVYTINDFDSTHLAGTNVTDYFKAYRSQYIGLTRYAEILQEEFYSLSDTTATVDLLLLNTPTNEGPHQFRTEIKLSDGRVLESISSSILLK